MDTKPWYSSKTIWASLVAGLATLGSIFGINIGDLTGQLTDQILGVVTLIGTLVAIYGRLTTRTVIAPSPPASGTYPKLLLAALLPALMFGPTSCSHMTAEQKTSFASYGSAIGAQIINAAANLGLSKLYGTLPSGNPYAASAANGLRTLQGTPLVTAAQIQDAITAFGDPDQPDKWEALGGKVAQVVTSYGTQAVTDTALESAAIALNQIQAKTVPIPPATPLP